MYVYMYRVYVYVPYGIIEGRCEPPVEEIAFVLI